MTNGLQVLEIGGLPRERGRAHGEGLRALIGERDRMWRAEIEAATAMSSDDFIEVFLQQTRFLPAIERWTPGLLEEVRGIAEGSGLAYAAVLAAQFMDEEWWFIESLRRQSRAPHHCSSLGVKSAGRSTLIGQTMDLPTWMDGFQALLLIRDAAPASEAGRTDAYVVTVAGMIGLMGMNSRGLGVCVNTLLQLSHAPDGLPVAFVSRGLLERPNIPAASNFIRAVRHASGQNYILGDPADLIDFECSASQATPFAPDSASARVWHANHPLANGDCQIMPTGPVWDAAARNSAGRYDALERRLARPGAIDRPAIEAILSSREDPVSPIARDSAIDKGRPGGFFTFAAMICELSADPILHVTAGPPGEPPDAHAFKAHRFPDGGAVRRVASHAA